MKCYLQILANYVIGLISPSTAEKWLSNIIDAMFREGFPELNVKDKGKATSDLKEVLSEAQKLNGKYGFLARLSLSNLEELYQGWLMNHLYLYRNYETGEVVILGVQDKVVIGKKRQLSSKSRGTFSQDIATANDVRKAMQFLMGLWHEIRSDRTIKDSIKGVPDALDNPWAAEKGILVHLNDDVKQTLEFIGELISNPESFGITSIRTMGVERFARYSYEKIGTSDRRALLDLTLGIKAFYVPEFATVHSVLPILEESKNQKLREFVRIIYELIDQIERNFG